MMRVESAEGHRLEPASRPETIHYTPSTRITAFGVTQSVSAWAVEMGDCVMSLLRRLNALPELPAEVVLELPKNIRIRDVPLGAPKSWTWTALPWEADRWAQEWVSQHLSGGTLEEVGDALGVTRERVRQIEVSAIRKLERNARLSGAPLRALLDGLRDEREGRAYNIYRRSRVLR